MCVNDLPRVAAPKRGGRESNSRPADRKSNTVTIMPQSHTQCALVCVIVNCSGVNSTPLQSISDVTKGVSHFVNGLSANSGQMRPCMGFMLALQNSQSVNSGFDSRLRNDSMQVVHTCDSVSEQYNLVPVGAGQRTVIPCD